MAGNVMEKQWVVIQVCSWTQNCTPGRATEAPGLAAERECSTTGLMPLLDSPFHITVSWSRWGIAQMLCSGTGSGQTKPVGLEWIHSGGEHEFETSKLLQVCRCLWIGEWVYCPKSPPGTEVWLWKTWPWQFFYPIQRPGTTCQEAHGVQGTLECDSQSYPTCRTCVTLWATYLAWLRISSSIHCATPWQNCQMHRATTCGEG